MKLKIIEKKEIPSKLISASVLYIIPAVYVIFATMNQIVEDLFLNFKNCIMVISTSWTSLLVVYHILIGIGLYKRNIIAWWASFVWPIICLFLSILLFILSFEYKGREPLPFWMGLSSIAMVVIYYGIIIRIITRPEIKILFKTTDKRNLNMLNGSESSLPKTYSLSPHLSVLHCATNTGMLVDGNKILLIDCGAGTVEELIGQQVDTILLTHYHRDGFCDIWKMGDVSVWASKAEQQWLENAEDFWNDLKNRWHLYNYRPSHLVAVENIKLKHSLRDLETFGWGATTITAIATSGHTDGSMSYLVQVDGIRVVFTGDMIYDAGQIWELLSLQHGDENLWDYHAFLGGRGELITSLRKVLEFSPDALIPTHGVIMNDPKAAVDLLAERLDAAWENYISVNTIRSYFPDKFTNKPEYIPIRDASPAPACLRHIDTSWILISNTGAAFVMDCGTPGVVSELQRMLDVGEINAVEGLWITHMHDDHVNLIPEFQKIFDCPLYADPAVADVITDPLAWRIPCISPSVARVDRRTDDGESWQWHEYTLTAYNFPGQTLYHDGLLVESANGPRMFFVGDSFALAGMDDYCAHNRNFLGAGVGFDYCIDLLQKLQPDLLFNPHVEGGFSFTTDEYQRMRDNLATREVNYNELFPWEHPNFATDDFWARCHPYEQDVKPGETTSLNVVITNHANTPQTVTLQAKSRTDWATNESATSIVQPKSEATIPITIQVPKDLKAGRYTVAVDVTMGERMLPEFTETVLKREE
jgi:glyoxylase-like metal-dependent hydrolase (beta-lactamase superfamily II)